MSTDGALEHEQRLLGLAFAYAPLAAGGAWLSLRYGVGARPGGDPGRDLVFRGTGLAPPLFLPVALVGAAALAQRQDRVGVGALVMTGLVGVAFTAGSTLNLPSDLAAARAAGSPVGLTVGFAALHWLLGPTLTVTALLAVRGRVRASRSDVPTDGSGDRSQLVP
jgi:hypothetical protein